MTNRISIDSAKKQIDSLAESLKEDVVQWKVVYIDGTEDPFYEDGVNLNLIRERIISTKKAIKGLCDENNLPFPKEYFTETPQEVDRNFMARQDEIHKNAVKTLSAFKKNKDYQYLLSRIQNTDEDTKRSSKIDVILSYVDRLRIAIEQNDYVTMRLYENNDRYFTAIRDCAETIRLIPESKNSRIEQNGERHTQISLFD